MLRRQLTSHTPLRLSYLSPFASKVGCPNASAQHGGGLMSDVNLVPHVYSTVQLFQPSHLLLQWSQPPPAAELIPIPNAAPEHLGRLRNAVAAAELDVLKLRHIIKCFERSIGMNRDLFNDEYDALEKGVDVKVDFLYVRATTTLGTFSKEKAEQRIREAEQKMEKAEQKIREAEQEMEKAEQKIREAKLEMEKEMEKAEQKIKEANLEMEKAKIFYTPDSLARDAENTKHCMKFKFKGNSSNELDDLGGRKPFLDLLRNTLRSLGVPKTGQASFALTLAGTNGVGKTHCSFLIGSSVFNQDPQVSMVSAYCGVNNGWPLGVVELRHVSDEFTLKDVIFTRVALALHHRANNLNSPWVSLSILNTKVLPHEQAFDLIVSAMDKIKLSKPQASKHVVFGVFDEIQLLEERLQSGLGATHNVARLIFRILRELQLRLVQTGVLFVGFGTGTLFRSSISDVTLGQNVVLNEPFCDRDVFESLVRADTPLQNKIITRMIYPRARLIGQSQDSWLNLVGALSVENAKHLLPYALEKYDLHITEFKGCAPFLGAQVPEKGVDQFMPLDDYILMFKCVRALTSFQCAPHLYLNNCDDFESWVGDALCAVLALATSERAGPKVREAVIRLNPWVNTVFGTGAPLDALLANVRIVTPDNSKGNILPFTGARSLKEAIKNGVNSQISDLVGAMVDNSLIMFRCKGSAPFDYVMIAKYTQGKGGSDVKLRAALFDSKHSEDASCYDTTSKEMAAKYKGVSKALKKAFADLTLTIAPPFIVTNRKVPQAGTSGVVYITGDTLCLGGLTRAAIESIGDGL